MYPDKLLQKEKGLQSITMDAIKGQLEFLTIIIYLSIIKRNNQYPDEKTFSFCSVIFYYFPCQWQKTRLHRGREEGFQAITQDALKIPAWFSGFRLDRGSRIAGEKGEYISADYMASLLQVHQGLNQGRSAPDMNLTNTPEISKKDHIFRHLYYSKRYPERNRCIR